MTPTILYPVFHKKVNPMLIYESSYKDSEEWKKPKLLSKIYLQPYTDSHNVRMHSKLEPRQYNHGTTGLCILLKR